MNAQRLVRPRTRAPEIELTPAARVVQGGRITGEPRVWARDVAIVGGATSALVPALVGGMAPELYWLAAGLAGALTGGLFGYRMPALLDRVRGKVPIPVLLAMGFPFGAIWGLTVGLVAVVPYALTGFGDMLGIVVLSAVCASLSGAIQFGWWWFPYTFQTVRGGRTWPVTAVGVLALPFLAVLSVVVAMALML